MKQYLFTELTYTKKQDLVDSDGFHIRYFYLTLPLNSPNAEQGCLCTNFFFIYLYETYISLYVHKDIHL